MARTEARIFTSVWDDEDFIALTIGAQWLYWLLISQRELSMCGVMTVAADRWAQFSVGTKRRQVDGWLAELDAARFVVVDAATTEVWIRALIRRDGACRAPNLIVALARAYEAVHSQTIQAGIVEELHREFGGDIPTGILQRFPKGFPNGFDQRFPQRFRDAVHGPCTHVRAPLPVTPSPSHQITPSPDHQSSSSPAVPPTAPAERADDDNRFAQVVWRLAEADLARLRADKPDHRVGDEDRWLESARRRRTMHDGDRIRDLLAENPTWGAPDALRALTSTAADTTSAAARALEDRTRRRQAGEACPTCDDMFVVERGDQCVPCPECRAVELAAIGVET